MTIINLANFKKKIYILYVNMQQFHWGSKFKRHERFAAVSLPATLSLDISCLPLRRPAGPAAFSSAGSESRFQDLGNSLHHVPL